MGYQIGHRIRVTAVMTLGFGVTINNVFELKATGNSTGTNGDIMLDLAQWLDDAYTFVVGDLTDQMLFTEVHGMNVTLNEPWPVDAWPVLTHGGTGGEYEATGVSLLLLLRTAFARVVGRKYLGVVAGSAITNGLVAAGVGADMLLFGGALVAGPTMTHGGGSLQYGVFSKTGAFHTVTAFAVSAAAAYQRRRRPGRGI